jgi:hypothetical protein
MKTVIINIPDELYNAFIDNIKNAPYVENVTDEIIEENVIQLISNETTFQNTFY